MPVSRGPDRAGALRSGDRPAHESLLERLAAVCGRACPLRKWMTHEDVSSIDTNPAGFSTGRRLPGADRRDARLRNQPNVAGRGRTGTGCHVSPCGRVGDDRSAGGRRIGRPVRRRHTNSQCRCLRHRAGHCASKRWPECQRSSHSDAVRPGCRRACCHGGIAAAQVLWRAVVSGCAGSDRYRPRRTTASTRRSEGAMDSRTESSIALNATATATASATASWPLKHMVAIGASCVATFALGRCQR